ncbi:MAG: hypothetical protein EG828_05525 [Deltaproteobacteria bacterium]|nr:hypothetical protein [Deltaproteobacteria bacterium]
MSIVGKTKNARYGAGSAVFSGKTLVGLLAARVMERAVPAAIENAASLSGVRNVAELETASQGVDTWILDRTSSDIGPTCVTS